MSLHDHSNYYKGDPLGIHDPSEAELGGVGTDSDGRFAKRSRKIIRGFFLMVIIALCWVITIHLLRMSFHTERVLLAISPIAGNFSQLSTRSNRNTRQTELPNNTAINNNVHHFTKNNNNHHIPKNIMIQTTTDKSAVSNL